MKKINKKQIELLKKLRSFLKENKLVISAKDFVLVDDVGGAIIRANWISTQSDYGSNYELGLEVKKEIVESIEYRTHKDKVVEELVGRRN